MNVLLLTMECLRYDRLCRKEGKNINTYVFDTFYSQSNVFHNFRLRSPLASENLDYLKKEMDSLDMDVWFSEDMDLMGDYEYFSGIKKKNPYVAWKHFPLNMKALNNDNEEVFEYDCFVTNLQEYVKNFMDFFDSQNLLKDTVIIFSGLGSYPLGEKHYGEVFGKSKVNLYDDNLHVPFFIFHPEAKAKDVNNSIILDNLSPTIKEFFSGESTIENRDDGAKINWSLAKAVLEEKVVDRFDVYSKYKNTLGLRGPMFQYYCEYDLKKGKVGQQELYDLNNDYKMRDNLMPKTETIGGQVIHLVNEYRNRVLVEAKYNTGG